MKSKVKKAVSLILAILSSIALFAFPVTVFSTQRERGQPSLKVALQTRHPLYAQGELVEIFGNVTGLSETPVRGASVALEVLDANSNTIFLDITTSNTDGSFSDSFRLPVEAPSGQYTVYAVASGLGYGSGSSQTVFTVGTFAIWPNYGGNNGIVTVKIVGLGFSEGAVPKLVRNNYTDIVGWGTIIVSTILIKTTFDLIGADPGIWDVVVTLANGTDLKLEDAFTIFSGGEPVLYMDVTGRDQIRVGQTATYSARIYNKGNIDSGDTVVGIEVDEALKVMRVETMDGIVIWDRVALENNITEGQTLYPEYWEGAPEGIVENFLNRTMLWIPNIAPGSFIDFKITVYAKIPWDGEDPIFLVAVALAVAKFALISVGLTFVRHLIAQAFYVALDPVQDKDVLHALWRILQRSFRNTITDLGDLVGFVSKGIIKLATWLIERPDQVHLWLVEAGVPWDKAGDVVHRLTDPLQKLAPVAKHLTKILWFAQTIYEIFKKIQLVRAEQKPPEATADKGVTPVWARDPNAKAGPTGYGPEVFMPPDIELPYTIYFENLANATAEAEDIVITDTLDTDLNWTTLSIVDTSHPDVMSWAFDPATGAITWTFTDINLPPNKVPPEGEGWVTFSIKPKPNMPSGTEIRNKATIVFDINPPMDTNETLNTIDSSPPTSSVLQLPDHSPMNFTVSWLGSDDASGVKDYTIWFSDNGGPWVIWLPPTTETSATFTGEPGHTYAFYSIAHDNVGNTEEPPEVPDAITTIPITRNIAVTNVALSKTIVGKGYCANITVTVENQGSLAETFNLAVYYNETAIILPDGRNYVTIILTKGNSTTLTFTWNTIGVAKGNYTITAKATPLPYETDKTDNEYVGGWVLVSIPGDIDGDGGVADHKDLLFLAAAYGSTSKDPNWNPNADINNDGKVDHKDLLILAANYGKENP